MTDAVTSRAKPSININITGGDQTIQTIVKGAVKDTIDQLFDSLKYNSRVS